MSENLTIIPLKQLNIAARMAELNALASQANSYTKLISPTLPGLPDFAAMFWEYVKKLVKELLEKLRQKLVELLMLIMAKVGAELIPIINKIIKAINAGIDGINAAIDFLMPAARILFKILVACAIVYIVCKIVCEVIPDFGAGMGAVTVFTTPVKNALKFIGDGALWCYEKVKPICYGILSAMRMLLKWFGFLQIIAGFINMLRMFEHRQQTNAEDSFNKTASDWENSVGGEDQNSAGGGGNEDTIVECTLPDGSVENMTIQECIAAGGTFPGQDLLSQLNDLNTQIALSTSQDSDITLDGDAIVQCLLPDGSIEEMSYDECIAAGGTPLTADQLAALIAERDDLLDTLNGMGLGGASLDEDILSTLLNVHPDVTHQDIVEEEGVVYGFGGDIIAGTYSPSPETEEYDTHNNNPFNTNPDDVVEGGSNEPPIVSDDFTVGPDDEESETSGDEGGDFRKGGKIRRKPKIKK